MRVLVTGVAGFIGSNLAAQLLSRGYEVVGVDNLSQGELLNMEAFRDHPAFRFEQTDIRNYGALAQAAAGCPLLIHLAAYKIPRYSSALDTLTINSLGTENVLRAAVENGARVIAASTSDVYGKNPAVPFHEDSDLVVGNPDVKRWAYAISKMFEEQLLFAYHDEFGLDVVPIRFFGGYGPNQNLTWWGGPQSVFINSALDNEEIPLHGDGQQTRSFTYIDDHVDAMMRMVENRSADNKVFNVGNPHEITIEGLARLIWRLVRGDEPAKLRFVPYESFGKYEDVMRRIPDISRARDILGFEPQVELENGLRKTIEWQIVRRQRLGIPTQAPSL